MAFTVAGCDLYFGPGDGPSSGGGQGTCLSDGYYVDGEWVSAQCPGGGNECASNDDCAAGCHCVVPDGAQGGTCEEAGFCSEDADCAAGYTCDERSSCIPDPNPPSCAAPIDPTTCTNGAPKCAAGQVPLVQDGCWADINNDGRYDCSAITQCAAPPTCTRLPVRGRLRRRQRLHRRHHGHQLHDAGRQRVPGRPDRLHLREFVYDSCRGAEPSSRSVPVCEATGCPRGRPVGVFRRRPFAFSA